MSELKTSLWYYIYIIYSQIVSTSEGKKNNSHLFKTFSKVVVEWENNFKTFKWYIPEI